MVPRSILARPHRSHVRIELNQSKCVSKEKCSVRLIVANRLNTTQQAHKSQQFQQQ